MKEYIPKQVRKKERGRRIAIGDIHGCFFTFKDLIIDQLQITKEDQVFLLGDIIGKGVNSSLVLDLLFELKEKNYQIFPIKGNHEERLLIAYSCGFDFFEVYLEEYNSLDLLGDDLEEYLKLIYSFDYCVELDDFFLSHSGLNQEKMSSSTDLRGMFPRVKFKFDERKLMSKIQIHGHLVRTIEEIKASVLRRKRKFSIDSGCYLEEDGFGYLTAIDLDNMELYHQKRKSIKK